VVSSLALVLPLLAAGPADAQNFVTKVRAPETTKWKWFGNTIAMDSNTMVVSAPESIRNADTSNCTFANIGYGAVAIYKKSFGNWNYSQKFWHDPVTTTNEVKFGNSLSLRGNVLVVSAERLDAPGSIFQAGGFTVFTRPTSSSNFTRLGTFFDPNPQQSQRLGETSGLASNASFIAIGDPISHNLLVYRIQGTSITYAYSVPLPVPGRASALYLTSNNVLVGMILGYPTLFAYSLTSTGYTTIDTSSLGVANALPQPALAGDGNTVGVVLYDGTGTWRYRTQVVNFNGTSVNWSDTRPLAPGLFLPDYTYNARRLSIKEGSGFFVSFDRYDASFNQLTFLAGFKYTVNSGSGHDYNYQGTVLPLAYPGLGSDFNPKDGLAFNGTDLALGDISMPPSTSGGACGSDSNGGIDLFTLGSVATSGPSGSTKLQPWLTSTAGVGSVVASSPGYAVVSSGSSYGELGMNGQAILYRKVGTQWEEQERYLDGLATVDGTAQSTGFGSSAAINFRSVLIGAPWAGDPFIGTPGRVYFANASNGGYQHGIMNQSLMLPSSVNDGDAFGSALAVDNSTLVVGAVMGGSDDLRSGSAYVYTWSTTLQSWTFRQELQPPSADLMPWLAFGAEVAISGDFAVVSAPFFDGSGLSESGAVYVYRRSGSTFNFQQRLVAPSPSNFDDFGQTVAVSGNFIAASGNNSGVRLFRWNGSSFVNDGSVSVSGMQFAPVALSSSGLLVATPTEARVRRFSRVNGTWQLGGTLNGPANEAFGSAVAMSGTDVVVGATISPVGQFVTGAGFATSFGSIP
jgi:hypothetical protein